MRAAVAAWPTDVFRDLWGCLVKKRRVAGARQAAQSWRRAFEAAWTSAVSGSGLRDAGAGAARLARPGPADLAEAVRLVSEACHGAGAAVGDAGARSPEPQAGLR